MNAVKTDVKQALLAELSRRGYEITFNHDASDAATSEKYAQACKAVIEHQEQSVLSAPPITRLEYDELSKGRHLTAAERFMVMRYDYVQLNHGSEADLDKLVKIPLDTLGDQVRNLRLLTEDITKLQKWQRDANRGIGLAADRSTFAEVAKLLQEIEKTWDGVSHKGEIGSLDGFVDFITANAGRVQHLLGWRVRSNSRTPATKLLGKYLSFYGLKTAQMGRVRINGKQAYRYQIDEENRTLMFRLAGRK